MCKVLIIISHSDILNMNTIIKEQLSKCCVASIPPFDDSTTQLIIRSTHTKNGNNMLPQHYYIIELDDWLLSSEQSRVFHQNWNGGNIPTTKCLKCECIKIMGNMVKVNGIGFDKSTSSDIMISWCGWLPLKNINNMGELA